MRQVGHVLGSYSTLVLGCVVPRCKPADAVGDAWSAFVFRSLCRDFIVVVEAVRRTLVPRARCSTMISHPRISNDIKPRMRKHTKTKKRVVRAEGQGYTRRRRFTDRKSKKKGQKAGCRRCARSPYRKLQARVRQPNPPSHMSLNSIPPYLTLPCQGLPLAYELPVLPAVHGGCGPLG